MPVVPCCANLFVYHKELYQFLLACQQNSLKRNCRQIVSISLEIEKIDPLIVFDKIATNQQLNFYIENTGQEEAIAAIGTVAKLQVEGSHRFAKAQEFIKSCLASTTIFGTDKESFAGPHFFCSFSFFEKNTQTDSCFPSATVFLPRWQILRQQKRCTLVANLVVNPGTDIEILFHDLWQKIEIITLLKGVSNTLPKSNQELTQQDVTTPEHYKRAVLSSLQSIRDNHFSKIVLAYAIDVNSRRNFSLFHSLNNLRQLYTDCYIFSTSNGRGQNFIGASPERLISIHNQKIITDALAGSAPRGKSAAEDMDLANCLLSNEKEKREHQFVINFITEKLYQLGLRPQVLQPQLRQLANIQHLWTPITAQVPTHIHPLEIVAKLHPTPAVAGAARDVVCNEICRYETFERGLYAAPLGWVDYQGNSEFIVGIRSALINGNKARLYAGAGIVAGSNPDKELAEVQLKLQALLRALV